MSEVVKCVVLSHLLFYNPVFRTEKEQTKNVFNRRLMVLLRAGVRMWMHACASVLRRVSVVSRRRSLWEEDPAKNTESVGFPGFFSRRFCSIVKTWYQCCITCHGYPGYSREPNWKSMGLPEISSVTWKAWIYLISRTGSMSLPGP